jgi:quercetin dioxygenase-like cupin family protein
MVKPLAPLPGAEARIAWRDGVQTRLHARGAEALCVMEQWCAPGSGAPTHTHFDVEEAIVLVAGEAEFWIDNNVQRIAAGGSILLPAYSRHGFRNTGAGELHTLAVFASADPRVEYEDEPGAVYEIRSHLTIRVEGER